MAKTLPAYSRITSKSQTVVPQAVREALKVGPGDTLRYRETQDGVVIEKVTNEAADDPFATFAEWATVADDEAYADL